MPPPREPREGHVRSSAPFQKRKKRVVLPIAQELLFALEAERDRRKSQPDQRILVNPRTGDPMTRPRLYERMLALGKRAGVPDAQPHRYRDSFAVDMLARGASPYDVAKLLGDTVATVERHYAPFVKDCGTAHAESWKVAKVWRKPIAQILHSRQSQKTGFIDSKRDSGG